MQRTRKRVEVNLEELDQIIDRSMHTPLNQSEGQKLKTAIHVMAERLSWKRTTEKSKRPRITRNTSTEPCPVQFGVVGSSLGGRPVVRQKLGNPGNGMIGDAGENVFEPGERIDSDALTGSHETPQHRGGLAALIAAKEYPVVAAHCYAADRALGGVVVDLEISVLAVAG